MVGFCQEGEGGGRVWPEGVIAEEEREGGAGALHKSGCRELRNDVRAVDEDRTMQGLY